MTCHGVVRFWDDEEGWGVVDSSETPGGCWAHFSDLMGEPASGGGRISIGPTPRPGDEVKLDWESGAQDGYDFRAVGVRSLSAP